MLPFPGGLLPDSPFSSSSGRVPGAASHSVRDDYDSVLQNAKLDIAEAIQEAVITSCTWVASTALQNFALRVAEHEDLNMVDGYERHRMGIEIEGSFMIQMARQNERAQKQTNSTKEVKVEKNLPVISPVIDGRLKDLDGKAGKADNV